MKEAIEALVQDVIARTGLPIVPGLPGHGSGDDYELGWSGRRIEGMPENFFAQIHICGNKSVMGFYLEVDAYGYDMVTRDGFSIPYWEGIITRDTLHYHKGSLREEIREVITRVWNDLPRLYQEMMQEKREQERLLERLRREGKLAE